MAVGYGLEAEFAGLHFRSYWQLDTLSQPTIRGHWPRRWIVSGTGDGGLIDAIRLRLFDVDQKRLTDVLVGRDVKGFNPGSNWPKLITSLRTDFAKKEAAVRDASQGKSKDAVSRAIHSMFEQAGRDHEDAYGILRKFLERQERTDTVVYLQGRQEMPYELGAALFHRFLIYLLRRHCGLRYLCGNPRLVNSGPGAFRFAFDPLKPTTVRLPAQQIDVDEVVIRHGAECALGGLVGPDSWQSAKDDAFLKAFDDDLWAEPLDPQWAAELKSPIPPDKQ